MPHALDQPRRWRRPRRIFVNSMSDLFHPHVSLNTLQRIWAVMAETPQHQYQILTKRPERMAAYIPHLHQSQPGCDLSHIWCGTSIENHAQIHRLAALQRVPSGIRFLSCEPLLGPLRLNLAGIHWVIVGGESGPGVRPMRPDWVHDIHQQCEDQRVPFFFKQWGAFGTDGVKRSKKDNGRLLHGHTHDSIPIHPTKSKNMLH